MCPPGIWGLISSDALFSKRPVLVPLHTAEILLMKACYLHPSFNCISVTGGLKPRIEKAKKVFKWRCCVHLARRSLRKALKAAKRYKLPTCCIEVIRTQIRHTDYFSASNDLNSTRPDEITRYILTASDAQGQLQRIEELFAYRHVLPIRNAYEKLFVQRVFMRRDVKYTLNADISFFPKMTGQEMFEIALDLQEKAHSFLRCALTSKNFCEYLHHLNLAAPYYRAAVVAFDSSRKRFTQCGDETGIHNAKAERYVSEEWFTNCAGAVKDCGTVVVCGPFIHLEILAVQGFTNGIQRSVDDLISYLRCNDVMFPSFCRSAWDKFAKHEIPEDLIHATGDSSVVEKTMANLFALMPRYIWYLRETLDDLSFELLLQCLRIEKFPWRLARIARFYCPGLIARFF